MKISIITPCFNAQAYLEATILSIRRQAEYLGPDVLLEHVIVDGASTDNSLELIQRVASPGAIIISEPDRGMYDALAKGFRMATGDIIGYLNAGDLYINGALSVVNAAFKHKAISWLTGINTNINEHGQVVSVLSPPIYRRKFVRKGYYGKLLPFIQQESTFWRRSLLDAVDFKKLSEFRLAGDYYLWCCFAEAFELYIVQSQLGSFRQHEGQLSSALSKYHDEVGKITECKLKLSDRIFSIPDSFLFRLNSRRVDSVVSGGRKLAWNSIEDAWTLS